MNTDKTTVDKEPLINPDGKKELFGLFTGMIFGMGTIVSMISRVTLFVHIIVGVTLIVIGSGIVALSIYLNRNNKTGGFFRRVTVAAKYVQLGLNALFLIIATTATIIAA